MTPEEFKVRVQELIDGNGERDPWKENPGRSHELYDELLEQVLRELGYEEGVDLVDTVIRWYS